MGVPIEKLEEFLEKERMSKKIIDIFKKHGIVEIEQLFLLDVENIMAILGCSEDYANEVLKVARRAYGANFPEPVTASQYKTEEVIVETPLPSLNNLLGGGFKAGTLIEVAGMFASGKCVSKDTPIPIINDDKFHFYRIEEAYEYYKNKFGEIKISDGYAVPLKNVKVLSFSSEGVKPEEAAYIYKEFVNRILRVRTRRGRELKLTKAHKLLTFKDGKLVWMPAGLLNIGDYIAAPKMFNYELGRKIDTEDAYFIGLYVAEGTSNPPSITISDERIVEFLVKYIKKKFGYTPRVRKTKKNLYLVLFRKPTIEFLGKLAKTKADTKFIPSEIFSSKELAISFLKGYIEGDGYLEKCVEMTTKSQTLAIQLTYLLKLLGISCTIRKKHDKKYNTVYYRVYIVGHDRNKIFELFNKKIKTKHSEYGYPRIIQSFIRKLYKETLGGNRGGNIKVLGKRTISKNISNYLYKDILIHIPDYDVIIEPTFEKIIEFFSKGIEYLKKLKELVEKCERKEFGKIAKILPFPLRLIARKLGMNGNTLENYVYRGLPNNEKSKKIIQAILEEIDDRIKKLEEGIEVLKIVSSLEWDKIIEIKEIDYNDYIYDFVVPKTHCFVGGNLPTLLHNTQFLFTQAVLEAAKGNYVLFIDTEKTFSPERIREIIVNRYGAEKVEEIMNRILVFEALSSTELRAVVLFLIRIIPKYIQEGKKVSLICIDSLVNPFRAEYSVEGLAKLAERQQVLNWTLRQLLKIAHIYRIVVIFTNQVVATPGSVVNFVPSGGNIVAHASTIRFLLIKGSENKRKLRVYDAPDLPSVEIQFKITEKGIEE